MAKAQQPAVATLPQDAKHSEKQTEPAGPTVVIEIPLADPPDTQFLRTQAFHVDAQLNRPEDRRALMRLYGGLDKAGARLATGRRVSSYADAVRWLLERIAESDIAP